MIEAFSSYGRSGAVIFACAFAVFFSQEIDAEAVLGVGVVVGGFGALILWIAFRGTEYRFLAGAAAVVTITLLTFLINKNYAGSIFANVAAFILFASLAFFAIYSFIRPSPRVSEKID